MKNIINVKKIIFIAVIAIALVISGCVYAANDSFKTGLKVDKTQVKRGETVTVTISLSDIAIESGEKGIGAYTAKLDFDSSILEYVSASGAGKWETPLYQDTYIVGNTNDGNVVNTNQSIGTITFKVKANATLGETTIKLINFSGSTAETDVTAPNSSVKITIADKDSGSGNGEESKDKGENGNGNGGTNGSGAGSGNTAGGSNNQNGQNVNSGNNVTTDNNIIDTDGNTFTNTTTTNTSNKENTKQSVLPKTGVSNFSWIYIIIAICVLFAIACMVKIKLLNNKSKHANK